MHRVPPRTLPAAGPAPPARGAGAFEGAVAACGAPIVGWLAERLGFQGDDAGSGGGGLGPAASDVDQDLKRARALGDAVVITTAVRARSGGELGCVASAGRWARVLTQPYTARSVPRLPPAGALGAVLPVVQRPARDLPPRSQVRGGARPPARNGQAATALAARQTTPASAVYPL